MQESVWNNRYPRFQCTLHIAGNRLGVVCIHYRPFPSEEEGQNAMDDLERKSQGHVIFSDLVINEYTTKLCSYVYISFFIGRVCCFILMTDIHQNLTEHLCHEMWKFFLIFFFICQSTIIDNIFIFLCLFPCLIFHFQNNSI